LHVNVEFATDELNANDGVVPFVGSDGPPVIVVSGTGGVGVGDGVGLGVTIGVGVGLGVGLAVGVGPAPRLMVQESMRPMSAAAASWTCSFQVPLAGSDDRLMV
jgi:hypothetical protein